MSLYTTGELAKKCNVSVRTIQYYDERGILVPTELTEGGRRLFSEKDVATLETICFLRDLDISIKDIAEILEADESKKVIGLLLDEQDKNIEEDIRRKTEQLKKIKNMRNLLDMFKDGSQKTIHDISSIVEEKEKKKKMYKKMLIIAIPLEIIEIVTFMIGILKGIWLPFFVAMRIGLSHSGNGINIELVALFPVEVRIYHTFGLLARRNGKRYREQQTKHPKYTFLHTQNLIAKSSTSW